MTTVTVTQNAGSTQAEILRLKEKRAPLRRRCLKAKPRVRHEDIAARAKCDRTLVVHYFAGRRSPEAVETAIQQLLAERRAS